MKILATEQIREVDKCTIANEPISSIDLMERAAQACADWIMANVNKTEHITVFAGMGNNGGDGLAIARILNQHGFVVACHKVKFTKNSSADLLINEQRLGDAGIELNVIEDIASLPTTPESGTIIDAIFGSGLTRPAEGFTAELIARINSSKAQVISVDVPSGLFCDDNSSNNLDNVVLATTTLTFQFPKLAFLLPASGGFAGDWHTLDIGLLDSCIEQQATDYYLNTGAKIAELLKSRDRFSHKGSHGHALIVAGSKGKIGAAVLAARSCLRTGAGLVSIHSPGCAYEILQESVPEAMVETSAGVEYLIGTIDPGGRTIGIGPGIGQQIETEGLVHDSLMNSESPMVIDADALNILSKHQEWMGLIPKDSILTPHPKEFERLAGKSYSDVERLKKLQAFASEHQCYVILKGAFTATASPDGSVHFNSTGNPGMATAGSGDVLTGLLTSLLAQGYTSRESAVIGTHLHGLAGDIATKDQHSMESVIAGDIIESIGKAFARCRSMGKK